ncbi:hypothetical protein [Arthrobacter methylotrophus]
MGPQLTAFAERNGGYASFLAPAIDGNWTSHHANIDAGQNV